MLAAAAALLAWRLGVELRRPPPPPPPAVRLLIPPPDGAVFGAGDEPLDAALSADGEEMVFVATSNGIRAALAQAAGQRSARSRSRGTTARGNRRGSPGGARCRSSWATR